LLDAGGVPAMNSSANFADPDKFDLGRWMNNPVIDP
jgi:hypothetical protein